MSNDVAQSITLNEGEIAQYLQGNPQFFERHPELLEQLKLDHKVHGSVSLVERQILSLREREKSLRQQLGDLIETAKTNDALLAKCSALMIHAIQAKSAQEVYDTVRTELVSNFAVDSCQMWLFDEAGILNHVEYGDKDTVQQLTEHKFTDKRPMCGRVTEATAQLFGGDEALQSYALIPMGDQASRGVIVLGSKSVDFFTADMGTLFLSLIGDITDACVSGH